MKPRVTRPRFLKLSYLLWIAVPLALYGVYLAYGLPHGIWSYSFIDEGQGHSPYAHRTYTRCHFIGPYGGFTVPAQGAAAAGSNSSKLKRRTANGASSTSSDQDYV